MLILVIAETMFFAGLISAHTIVKAGAVTWPPPGQPRLPIEQTLINTAALIVSGFVLYAGHRAMVNGSGRALRHVTVAWLLGAFFVLFQGAEWVALIRDGLTLTSSTHGSFFYLIVGAHALHALGGLSALGWAALRLRARNLVLSQLMAVEIFWYFVVALWPILYWRVYL